MYEVIKCDLAGGRGQVTCWNMMYVAMLAVVGTAGRSCGAVMGTICLPLTPSSCHMSSSACEFWTSLCIHSLVQSAYIYDASDM